MKGPVIDLKIQLDPNGIPPVMMAVLKKGPGAMSLAKKGAA